MKIIYSLIILLIIIGCSKDDNHNGISDNFKIRSYHANYLHYPVQLVVNPNYDNVVKLEYDLRGRIIKRIGDVVYTAMGGYISNSLYADLSYDDNKIYLTKETSDNSMDILQYESIITFDAHKRMSQKIIFI